MTKLLIGLTGKAMAGKDTVSGHLFRQYQFFRQAFANPLRDGLQAMFGLGDWHFSPEKKEEVIDWIGKSPRELMQTLGTQWGRDLVHRDIWCRHMDWRIQPHLCRNAPIVISDVRFIDEAQFIHSRGGQIWRVLRPGAETTPHSDHTSEQESQRIVADVELINDGTIDELFERVDAAYHAQLDEVEAMHRSRRAIQKSEMLHPIYCEDL